MSGYSSRSPDSVTVSLIRATVKKLIDQIAAKQAGFDGVEIHAANGVLDRLLAHMTTLRNGSFRVRAFS